MKRLNNVMVLMIASLFVFAGFLPGELLADGTETLSSPSVAIANGSGIVAAGVGLSALQPGTININVPGTVQQALLYWSCESDSDGGGDQTIVVDGTPVTGSSIGGNTKLDGLDLWTESFRAEITSMVDAGNNSLSISGLDCGSNNHGAGLLVIYDDGSGVSDTQLRDGNDFAFCGFSGTLNGTTPQTFTFAAESTARIADLIMFFGSVDEDRPNSIEISVNGTTQTLSDQLNSSDGLQWDTLIRTVNIPAGATSITVEVFSRDDSNPGCGDPLPASLVWSAAGISIPVEADGCLTRTPGFWCNRPFATEFVLGDGLEVCGITLDNVDAATLGSAIEDLVFGKDQKLSSPQQLQLIRQCTAAALNLEASFLAEGNCESSYPGITAKFEQCCVELCTSGASRSEISGSGCIEDLDDFNNYGFMGNELEIPDSFPSSKDSGPGHFPPGAADSDTCSEANGNGFINAR